MKITIAMHAHRKLRRMARYASAATFRDKFPSIVEHLPVPVDQVIGCYLNDGPSTRGWIVFTNNRIHIAAGGEWVSLAYSDIEKVELPALKDCDSNDVCVVLKSGQRAVIQVFGNEPNFRTHDKCMVQMFLESVITCSSACESQ